MSEDKKVIFSMNGVSKTFQSSNQPVLKNIYLSFFYGAKIGILGLNGSGKSSLLKIIAGIDKSYQGDIVFSSEYKVGYLEQEPQLDKDKTVLEVVKEGVASTVASLIFGCLHFYNPEVEKLGYGLIIYYVGTGLFLGILTLMDGGIELALGFHAANNLVTALLVTSSWTVFQTESIFIDVSEPSLGGEVLISLFILYPFFIFLMSNRFNWSGWNTKLTSKL